MPEAKGARKYQGDFSGPTSRTISTPAVKDALDWIVSLGLSAKKSFDENEEVTPEEVKIILQRFAGYIGTEEKDDFFTTVNHDFFYSGKGDESVAPDSDYYVDNCLNTDSIDSSCLSFAREMALSHNADAPFYQMMLDYYEGKLDYSFLEEPTVKEEIKALTSIDSLTSWESSSKTLLQNYGTSSIISLGSTSTFNDNGVVKRYSVLSPGALPLFALKTLNESTINLYSSNFISLLGISSPELDGYVENYLSFEKKANGFYLDFSLDSLRNAYTSIKEGADDIFSKNGVTIDLPSFFEAVGLTATDMKYTLTEDGAAFVALGKALENATKEELVALSLVDYSYINSDAIGYTKGQGASLSDAIKLGEYNIASDYMSSDYFSGSFTALASMFDEIKSTFNERIDTSLWLSQEGKKTVKEKLEAVHYALMAKTDTGELIDYASFATPTGLNLRASIAHKRAAKFRLILAYNKNEGHDESSFLYANSPFYPNAFYFRESNGFCLTMGTAFWLGYDFSLLSKEELYGYIGVIIAHELTHGFDSNGVYYDKNGTKVESSIIPSDDIEKFTYLAFDGVNMYNLMEALPGYVQDNSVTIGECLADLGGFAFVESIVSKNKNLSLTKFYETYAKSYAIKASLTCFLDNFYADTHPFGRARINTVLSNSALFRSTYGLTENDLMYRDSSIVVW
jgi:predicted metalloendopeptidase